MFIGKESFNPAPDRESAKSLFARGVQRVEIETHSYCNRRCNYCPNVVGDRLGENKQISPEHWQMVVSNLQEIDYAHNLVFQSYNEPLADRSIHDRLKEARAALPKARLMIYSNGDYLNQSYLAELAEAGLNYIHVSIHTKYNGKYSDVDALNQISKLVKRLQCNIKYESIKQGEFVIAKIPHAKIEIEVRAINYFQHGNDRGGLVEGVRKLTSRTSPCHFPFAHFYMGFSGNIIPCCHIRSDVDEHAKYRYGNLSDFGSIFEAYAGQVATGWRRHLISLEPKAAPCDTCTAGFLSNDPQVLGQVQRAWEQHVRG